MLAAKAFFTVTAGIIPEVLMPEYTKQWGYTNADHEKDRETVKHGGETIFAERLKEAHDYAIAISNPARLNWVRVDWIWV